MKTVRGPAIELILGSWPDFLIDALRGGDRGVPWGYYAAVGNEGEKQFGNGWRVVRMQIPVHCCHSQLDQKAKRGTTFLQSARGRIDFVQNVPCVDLNVIYVAILLYYGQG